MKQIFLYAGQGSQTVGMGKDLYETYPEFKNEIDKLEAVLPFSVKELMWQGPEEKLMQTEYTQPCMAAFAVGLTAVLKAHGIVPDASAGLSLGEYGALYAAGVWSAEDYVKTVAFRGQAMADAVKGLDTAMSAVLGLDAAKAEEACKKAEDSGKGFVTVANYNCPGQYVICGEQAAVEAAEQAAAELGAKRCIRLKVSAPFHTKYLETAGEKLFEHFKSVEFNKPSIPVAMNVSGDFLKDGEDLKELLKAQVSNSVRFESDAEALLKAGAETFIEIGPGNALSGFVKKTAMKLGIKPQIISLTTAADVEKLFAMQA